MRYFGCIDVLMAVIAYFILLFRCVLKIRVMRHHYLLVVDGWGGVLWHLTLGFYFGIFVEPIGQF